MAIAAVALVFFNACLFMFLPFISNDG